MSIKVCRHCQECPDLVEGTAETVVCESKHKAANTRMTSRTHKAANTRMTSCPQKQLYACKPLRECPYLVKEKAPSSTSNAKGNATRQDNMMATSAHQHRTETGPYESTPKAAHDF